MFKFLPGIVLIQFISAFMVIAAFNWLRDLQLIVVVIMLSLIVAVLTAFWFAAIARDMYQDERNQIREQHALDREKLLLDTEKVKAGIAEEKSRLQEQHARERERILLNAEREKTTVVTESFRQLEKEIRKAQSRASLKVGAAFTLAAVAGGVMVFSQLVTVGMMVLVASGSGLAGYLTRARQERLSRQKNVTDDEFKLLEKK